MNEAKFIINDLKNKLNPKGMDTLIHFVTNRCNAKCSFCFYLDELNQPTDELTLSEIEKIAGQIGNLRGLLISGGEPFLRKDLADVISVYTRLCQVEVAQVPTNGFYTDRIIGTAERIAAELPGLNFTVSISIDAIGEKHDEIRKVPGMFSKIKNTAAELCQLKKHHKHLRFIVVSVLTPDTVGQCRQLADYVRKELAPDLHWFEPVRDDITLAQRMSITDEDCEFFSGNLQYYLRGIKGTSSSIYASSLLNDMITEYSLGNFRIAYDNLKNARKWPVTCAAAKKIVVLYPNGDLAPCELKDVVVNIRNFNFNIHDALKVDGFESVRQEVRRHACDCTHGCFIPVSTRGSIPYLARVFGRSVLKAAHH